MLARIRKSLAEKDNDKGFTLIELLVVMIIIGILAAIAIPVFLSQRAKARDTAVKADVSTLGKEIATWYVDNTTAPYVVQTAATAGRYLVGASSTVCTGSPNPCDVGKMSDVNTIISTYNAVGATLVTTALVASTALVNATWTSTAWCIAVYNASGSTKVYSYSATNGLQANNCTSAIAN